MTVRVPFALIIRADGVYVRLEPPVLLCPQMLRSSEHPVNRIWSESSQGSHGLTLPPPLGRSPGTVLVACEVRNPGNRTVLTSVDPQPSFEWTQTYLTGLVFQTTAAKQQWGIWEVCNLLRRRCVCARVSLSL